jgi:hypothetical protein
MMNHYYFDNEAKRITGIARDYVDGKIIDYNNGYSPSDIRLFSEKVVPEGDEANYLYFKNDIFRDDDPAYLALVAEDERKDAEIEALKTVDAKLSKTIYDLTNFIENRFLLTQTQIDQIGAMTTVAQLRAVILDRFSLTAGQRAYIDDFRTAYEAWIAAKG